MDIIIIILLIFIAGAIITAFSGKISSMVQDIMFLISILVPAVLFFMNINTDSQTVISLSKINLTLGLTPLSLFFAFIVFGLAILTGFYAIGQMQGKKRK
ncbi:MAG TPA: hypothetical protein ENK91_02225, partial [Bacteroidetes bacterium]|nr:hypothetical protein [Bacteroidota bacterium]